MNAIEKIGMLMKAKAFVAQIRKMSDEDAVAALLEATTKIADDIHTRAFNDSRFQIMKFLQENHEARTPLLKEIAFLPIPVRGEKIE